MRVFFFLLLFLSLICFASTSVFAYTPVTTSVKDLTLLETGVVKKVLKPDLIELENGKIYRLSGIRIPSAFRNQTKALVEELTLSKSVSLFVNPSVSPYDAVDRLGATYVHLLTTEGAWLQEKIITEGLAWAYGTENSRDLLAALQKQEIKAQKNRAGLWSKEEHLISNLELVKKQIDTFQIVEGKAFGTSCTYTQCFVNFESQFKNDFTILISQRTVLKFRNTVPFIKDPSLLTASTFRIRGWVERNNGPMIRLEFPEQIQFLSDLE